MFKHDLTIIVFSVTMVTDVLSSLHMLLETLLIEMTVWYDPGDNGQVDWLKLNGSVNKH